jgi:hypothetical protein
MLPGGPGFLATPGAQGKAGSSLSRTMRGVIRPMGMSVPPALIHNNPQLFHRVVVSTAETPPRMMVGMSIRDVSAQGAPVVGYFPR